MLWRLSLMISVLVGPLAPVLADGPFLDFEAPSDLARVQAVRADVTISDAHATSGRHSLKATLHAGDYPTVEFRVGQAFPYGDWRQYQSLEFDFYLDAPNRHTPAGEVAMPLFMQFISGAGSAVRTRSFMAAFTGQRQGHMSITSLGLQIGSEGLLASGTGFGRIAAWDTTVDTADIQRFVILADHIDRPVVLYLDNFRFTSRVDKPLVDEFGQYNLRDWPGKVHSEKELADAGHGDVTQLRRPLNVTDRDRYGGWTGGVGQSAPRFPARGRFWITRRGERWWLVTPDGNPFWSVGCDGITKEATSPKWDDVHKALYGWLPPHEGRFAGVWENSWTGGPVLAKADLIRRYGEEYAAVWGQVCARRLHDWGFNTLGAWCQFEEVGRHEGLRLPFVTIMGNQGDGPQMAEGLPDVYDAAWDRGVKAATQAASRYKDDPWCLGHFYDNELGWCGGWHETPTVAQQVLAKGPESAAKRALVTMLRERHGGQIAALNAAWSTSFASFDSIVTTPVKLPAASGAAAEPDFSAFLESTADRYYATVARALKAADPNHLYLGSRLAQHPIEAVRAAGRYCDIVSFNIYAVEVDRAEYDRLYAAAHRPFLVGEFNSGARDRGLLAGGGIVVGSQAARGAAYCRYVERLVAIPYFVGCHWFEWSDQPCVGRFEGWEAGNSGIVDVCFNPYPELTAAMAETNRRIYALASQTRR